MSLIIHAFKWLWKDLVFTLSNEVGGGGDSKEESRRADVTEQTERVQQIGNQFLSQLIPGSAEFNKFQSFLQNMIQRTSEGAFAVEELGGAVLDQQQAVRQFGEQIVSQQQQRIASGEPATALESRTDLAFQGLRDKAAFTSEEQAVFNALRGNETSTPTGDIFSQLVGRAQDPDSSFQSVFDDQQKLPD